MRTTNMMMANTFLRNLNYNNKKLNGFSNQLSLNKCITRASDDPIGTVRSIQTRKAKSTKTDFKKTVQDSKDMLTQTESCLMDVTEILKRMEELVGIGESDLYTTAQKTAAAAEVLQLRDEVMDIGNATYDGRYLFAGYNSTKPPFTKDSSDNLLFNGISLDTSGTAEIQNELDQITQYQIDSSTLFEVSVSGIDFMGTGDLNLYNLFTDIAETMTDPNKSASDMAGFSDKINAARDNNLAVIADVGGRTARLEIIESRYEDDLINLEEKRSNIEDIDQAEVITNYKFAYTAYQQALAVGAQIIQQSLLDYIR